MVMINTATGFRRVDLAKIALARSFGASTLQIFTKIRVPMAMPMIIVGLMVGSIFGFLSAIGAEMVGGAESLGSRLTYYSALIRMPQFFTIVLVLGIISISIYIYFYWLGKKWASCRSITPDSSGTARKKVRPIRESDKEEAITQHTEPHAMIDRRRLRPLRRAKSRSPRSPALAARRAVRRQTIRWVSARGSIEVLNDYPYWVAKRPAISAISAPRPGPSEATAVVKLVDQKQADVGFPSPGVFSLALEQGMPLVSVFHMIANDVFAFAFRQGEKPKDIKELEGKTVLLGTAGWQSICDPMLFAAGVDIKKIKYVEAGWPTWGTALKAGKGDTALSWEGLRAQWKGQGLDFDYILGRDFSKLPSNSFVIRKADFDDPAKQKIYARYLQGWAAGLEFGRQNPRAATQIVMMQFPGLASQMTPTVATESQMQLANAFAGRMDERKKWGYHLLPSWQLFFDTGRKIGQITRDFKAEDVCKNDLIDEANAFDKAKVQADAQGFALAPEYQSVDVKAIQAAL